MKGDASSFGLPKEVFNSYKSVEPPVQQLSSSSPHLHRACHLSLTIYYRTMSLSNSDSFYNYEVPDYNAMLGTFEDNLKSGLHVPPGAKSVCGMSIITLLCL